MYNITKDFQKMLLF